MIVVDIASAPINFKLDHLMVCFACITLFSLFLSVKSTGSPLRTLPLSPKLPSNVFQACISITALVCPSLWNELRGTMIVGTITSWWQWFWIVVHIEQMCGFTTWVTYSITGFFFAFRKKSFAYYQYRQFFYLRKWASRASSIQLQMKKSCRGARLLHWQPRKGEVLYPPHDFRLL